MRNFSGCPKKNKEQLYNTLVKPHLQYASAAWNPGTKKNKDILENVQRRAARYIMADFNQTSSVTDMLHQLTWETIEESRIKTRLRTLHKIITNQLAIDGSIYIKPKPLRNRRGHDQQYVLHETPISTPMVNSFFAESVYYWNALKSGDLPTEEKFNFTNLTLPTVTKDIYLPNYD